MDNINTIKAIIRTAEKKSLDLFSQCHGSIHGEGVHKSFKSASPESANKASIFILDSRKISKNHSES